MFSSECRHSISISLFEITWNVINNAEKTLANNEIVFGLGLGSDVLWTDWV